VTGTEGSIPPATAFDEDQIEIVTVIQNAGLVPDHGDLTQLWQALQLMIAKRYITTPITKTVHVPNGDFDDMFEALDWVADYTITPTGYVTFMVGAGRFTYNNTIEIDHPNASRIAIQGSNLVGGMPSGSDLAPTFSPPYHNAGDGTNQIVKLRAAYATEFAFTHGGSGFLILRGGAMLRYLLLTGTQSVSSPLPGQPWRPFSGIGSGLEVYDLLHIDTVSVWGFGNAGVFLNGGEIMSDSPGNNAFCYNTNAGIYGVNGLWHQQGGELIINSNGNCGFFARGGFYQFGYIPPSGGPGKVYCSGNAGGGGLGGMTLESGAFVEIGFNSNITKNSANGVLLAGSCTFLGEHVNYISNQSQHVNIAGTSTAWLDNSAFSGTATTVVCTGNGYAETLGSSGIAGNSSVSTGGIISGPQ
jgi:hypothetical protein